MASLQEIKLRTRSVKSTQKITKAMEMVAASKMRFAQRQSLKGRPYITKLSEMIGEVVFTNEPPIFHPFLQKNTEANQVAYILLTSNRGLCGGFNSNVIRTMLEILHEKKHLKELVITVGTKGRQAMERVGKSLLAEFSTLPEKPTFLDTLGMSTVVIEDFLSGKYQEVWLVYNHFYSTLSQRPVVKKLLPFEPSTEDFQPSEKRDYIFESDKKDLSNELLRMYIETSIYQTVLESIASEHSARMMAMKKASENAKEIVSNLTLHYNKARQSKITTEILEVVAGSQN
ncbi:ATP synthase F1 subunit gamma [Candidatus Peregrinibacteria bacterium]|nr:ATP synthase F1 subunit gamma [Candidatus Peregrinibacteria bacterium]